MARKPLMVCEKDEYSARYFVKSNHEVNANGNK